MGASPRTTMTYAEYLAAEDTSEVKHEYLRGQVWAMAGGTIEHGRLAGAVVAALTQALRGKPCVVLTSDVRIRVEDTDRSTYPDVSVVCGTREVSAIDPNALANPKVLVEVLSDSTEADDRGEKFAHYRRIPSLQGYVLVSQRTQRIEVYTRKGDEWVLGEAGPGQVVRVHAVDVELSVDEIYRDPAG
jgi:Uma2 family endonuclease